MKLLNLHEKHFALKQFIFVAALAFFLGLTAHAQSSASIEPIKAELKTSSPDAKTNDKVQTRVKQLEEQVNALQTQIEALRNLVNQTQAKSAQSEINPVESVAVKTETKTPETAQNENKPAAQQKQLGVDIGSARLTPYGTIFFNAFTNSAGTNNADVPLFAAVTGTGNTSASVRQTRLGFRLEGARIGSARLGGVIEADFFGGFPAVGIGENFGIVRLRLANARLDWEKTSLTVGQDWMVFAPVNPTSLAAAAIPQMAAAGNNWARIPQIKIERRFGNNITWQGAVLAPQTGDYPTASTFFFQPNSGAASRLPFFQTRLAASSKDFFGTKKAGSVGISAHYGRSRVFTGAANIENNIDSLGIALDWNVPLHTRVSLAGEAFSGHNLGGFQAGIFQSYNTDFAYLQNGSRIAGGVRAIGTRGGWMQIGFTPPVSKDRLSLYASLGVDDPHDEDLVSLTPRDFRARNLSYAFDLIYKFTPQLSFGAEFRRMQTDYFLSGRRNANHVNLSAAYSF
jgi:hypothetical protein